MNTLTAVWTFNSQKAIVIGYHGEVLLTEDSGESWEEVDYPGSAWIEGILFTSETVGWINSLSEMYYKTTDGGLSWQEFDFSLYQTGDYGGTVDLYFINENTGWIVYYNYNLDDTETLDLWQTTDGGDNWTHIYQFDTTYQEIDVSFIDEHNGFALQENALYRTTDGGSSWETILEGKRLESMHFLDENIGFVLENLSGSVLKTTDKGEHWDSHEVIGWGWEIQFTDEMNGVIRGPSIYVTDDGGVSWNPVYTPNSTMSSMHIAEDGAGYAVGEYGQILQTSDGGKTWEQNTEGYFQDLFAVDFVNRDIGWACGDHVILHTTNGGATWNELLMDITPLCYDIDFLNEKNGWIACSDYPVGSPLFHTTDGGENWEGIDLDGIDLDGIDYLSSVQFLNNRVGYACGRDLNGGVISGCVIKTADGGDTWNRLNHESSGILYDLNFVDVNNGWLHSSRNLFHTTDGGITWEYYEIEYGINHIQFIDERNGWYSSGNYLMHRTTDGGKTWYPQEMSLEWVSDFHFVDPQNGWASRGNSIYETHDGGITWEFSGVVLSESPRDIYFLDESIGWCVGGGGRIMRYDGASSDHTPRHSGQSLLMWQNYPNPFNNQTIIRYELMTEGRVTVTVYNVQGQEVETLADEPQNSGVHFYTWNPDNVSSGIYFCRVSTPYEHKTIKLVVIK
ncbi:YCF48-related protein [candidate division KSB1 bacterium]